MAWLLLTTLSVTNADDAAKCVKWYTYHWRIERYFHALKSGCKAPRIFSWKRVIGLRALFRTASLRGGLQWSRMRHGGSPDVDCTVFLSESEWKALYTLVHRTRGVPEELPSLRQAVRWIAQIGSFLGRKGDGKPGMKVTWPGLVALHERAYMWDVLMSGDLDSA